MKNQLTESDIQKMRDEIEHRKLVIRKEAIEAVKEARAQGDLSENFEYYAAKKYKNLCRFNHTFQIPDSALILVFIFLCRIILKIFT